MLSGDDFGGNWDGILIIFEDLNPHTEGDNAEEAAERDGAGHPILDSVAHRLDFCELTRKYIGNLSLGCT